MINTFNRESFGNRKDQALYTLNNWYDEWQRQKQQLVITSPNGEKSLLIGAQPTGEFGIAIYDNDGDLKTLAGSEGLLTLPNRDVSYKGDDNIKVEKEDNTISVSIQDSFRIETLGSVYPIGSIYVNKIDSTPPNILMNWNDSKWEQKTGYVLTEMRDNFDDPDPENNKPVEHHHEAFVWERVA